MRIVILTITLLLAVVSGHSQQLHFAFLQTDTRKPFYVMLNNKNYSSTASGYVILPKLQNGDYPLRIGFAKAEEAEQEYVLQVKDNDQGFLVKDFGDKGWGLFNLQTMAVQYAGTAAQERAKLAAVKAEAEQRQRKLAEEAQAAALQRQNDSLQTIAATQKAYTDSVAAAMAATVRQRANEDSVVKINRTVQQNTANDSATNAREIALEVERIQRKADSAANAQAAVVDKQKTETITSEQTKAVANENERLEKIADSTARVQAAVVEKKKVKAENAEIKKVEATDKRKADVTVKQKPETAVKIKKPKEAVKLPDNASVKVNEVAKTFPAPILIQQTFTDTGWHYAYNVTNNNGRETIHAFIPSAQPKLPVFATPVIEKEVMQPVTVLPDSTKPNDININQDTVSNFSTETNTAVPATTPIIAGSATTQNSEIKDSVPVVVEKTILNSNCKAVADEKDFLTARKKLAAAFGTEAMLTAARKLLKEKCYTTEQLRNLSVLFLTDADRYQFLDVAYPFAFDAYRYNTLQDLLTDSYYLQRFKSMLH